ncbi:MAG: hypothetical protein IPK75_01515 [Acidobacteria bacterium]|nr:hypothetical protein [Acidobacteriota bacterium]
MLSGRAAIAIALLVIGLPFAWLIVSGAIRENDGEAVIARSEQVNASTDALIDRLDRYYTPEQRAEHFRNDNVRNTLMGQSELWTGMPDDDRIRLGYVSANLVIDGVCELEEIQANGFKLYPSDGHLPVYETRCAAGGDEGLVLAYPATMEYRLKAPG